jgi:7,8-dihydroneopterin 2',3'-cyclic phosphate phosphodiesterase
MERTTREYIGGLFPAIEEIEDAAIREKVAALWAEVWQEGNYERIEDLHQNEAFRDRLEYSNVEHVNQVVACALKLAEVAESAFGVRVNRDYLLAGALLHDVDKLVVYDRQAKGLNERGKRFCHAIYGGYLVLKAGLPEEVAHMVAAHSPHYSSAEPRTLEAMILKYADEFIARTKYFIAGVE